MKMPRLAGPGLEIRGCWELGLEFIGCLELRAPLYSPAAPSNICREPNDVTISLHNTLSQLLMMQFGSLELFFSSPQMGGKEVKCIDIN